MQKHFTTRNIVLCGIVAALYIALVGMFSMISFRVFQVRVAEALTVLPFLFPITALGLFVGAFLSNLLWGLGALDVIIGSTATLIAGLMTAWMAKKVPIKWFAPIPPIVINALLVPLILLAYLDTVLHSYLFMASMIMVGQMAAAAGFGLPLLFILEKIPAIKAWREEDNEIINKRKQP